MAELWFVLLALMLIAYSVLDGFDFGAGILHCFVAETDAERRAVLAAIGPFWDGNEVWLIASGGVLFVAFPQVLTSAFPAFYLALHLLLWCLILRGIAIELRSHVADPLWHAFWDAVFGLSSALLALVFGVAFGNLVRGVPLAESGEFTLPFFSELGTTGMVGLLDYYTVSVGFFSLALLALHGAEFLAWRTQGALRQRALELGRRASVVVVALGLLVSIETHFVRPELIHALLTRPTAWPFIACALGGVFAIASARRHGDHWGFLGSSALIGGVLGAAAAGLFPTLLHSTLDARFDLDALRHAGDKSGLRIALVWWPVAFLLAVSYFVNLFRANRERVGE
ncbi:MAG TPA: cytochrome d ubiquinol oxidase subunit II [Polyangiaceae bacterium]|jgi:cytochrome d ubiquinol oxidase subunit II